MGVEGVAGKNRAACVWDGVRVKPGAGFGERGGERQSGGRDSLELSCGSNNTYLYNEYQDYGCQGYGNPGEWANSLRYRYSHTIVHTSTEFFEAAGDALREIIEKNKGLQEDKYIETEDYDDADINAAYGSAYKKLCEEIEKRHEGGEQWFDIDGTLLTRDREMERLNEAYEAAAGFQASSRRVMSGLRQLCRSIQEEARGESG